MGGEVPGSLENIEIADEILRSIRRIIRAISLQSRRLSKATGLTLPQIAVLRAIDTAPESELSVAGISRHVQLSSPTVSGILDRLERAGLVRRERGSTDRRKVWLHLTELGRQKLADTPAPLQDRFVSQLSELPAERQRELLAALTQVVELMDAEKIDASPFLIDEGELRKSQK